MVGPKLQNDIFPIAHPFSSGMCHACESRHCWGVHMFVSVPDANLQQMVWRKQPNQLVREYRLLMITYGTGNAPYLATRCRQQLAHNEDQLQQWSSGISLLVTYCKVPIKQMNPLHCNSNCVDYW